jgi:hypothetical protein
MKIFLIFENNHIYYIYSEYPAWDGSSAVLPLKKTQKIVVEVLLCSILIGKGTNKEIDE